MSALSSSTNVIVVSDSGSGVGSATTSIDVPSVATSVAISTAEAVETLTSSFDAV